MNMDAEMQVSLARIEEKLDGFVGHMKDVKADVQDHETRLRMIEKKLWGYSGAIGLVSAVSVSSALYLIGK